MDGDGGDTAAAKNPHEPALIAHWTALRSNLHDPASWMDAGCISLTYVPTLAGFSGLAQRDQFCALFPAHQHPLHPTMTDRFSNRLTSLRCHVDTATRTVVEEVALSMLHCDRVDWLLPGVEETRKVLSFPLILIGQLGATAPHLLESVRVYWDQGGIMRQSGLLEREFRGMARAGFKGADVEGAVERLPVVDGPRTAVRLANPTPYNCNPLMPLDCLNPPSVPAPPTSVRQGIILANIHF